MRQQNQQNQQTDDNGPEVIRSEPVPLSGPGQVDPPPADDPDGRHLTRYPEGTGDQGPDALDERGSYDSDLATSGPGPWSGDRTAGARTRDDVRGTQRLAEDEAEDDALDDDAIAERTPAARTVDTDGGDPGTGDRGDLADASQADASGSRPVPAGPGPDGTASGPADADSRPDDTDSRPEFHDPAPLPTTFGAPTVGGAVASAALAGSHRDPREEDTVRSGDGPAQDRIDGIGDEPAAVGARPVARPGEDRSLGAADAATAQRSEAAGRRPANGATSDASVAIGTNHPVNPDVLSAGNPDAVPDTLRGPAPGGSTAAGELLPGSAPAEPIVAILAPDTARGFRDRWREVQLRFVDDPPGATADAHRLVEESVEVVTAALAEQRDNLGGWQRDGATDTEQLRMVVRRHRDFLDRLLGR